MKRTLWGVLHDELWSMDVYDSRDQAEAARRSYADGVLPLVRVTEEVVDVGDWADLEPGGSTTCTCPSGDGSLRWPCPQHPPTPEPGGSDRGS